MFDYLPEICRELNAHIKELYWILLTPLVVFHILLEFLKAKGQVPSPSDTLRRVLISVILLLSFDECINAIAMIGDGVADRVQGISKLWDLLKHLEQQYHQAEISWLKLREAIMFTLGLLSYLVAYIGVFVANVLIHFVWSVLYVCSPLMILMFVSQKTAFITANLYRGLINVVVWKVLWSILGVMLLKLTMHSDLQNTDNFIINIMVNLCIGLSMLFIPFATKSLLNDGFSSAASALAMAPAFTTSQVIKQVSKKQAKKVARGSWNSTRSGMQHLQRPARKGLDFIKSNFHKRGGQRPPLYPSNVIQVDFNKGNKNE